MPDMTALHLQDEPMMSVGGNRMNVIPSPTWDYVCLICHTNIQEIIPGVFLGPHPATHLHYLSHLKEKGIRYIICVCPEHESPNPPENDGSITYLNLDIADQETENILRFFPLVNNFIDEALAKKSKVLVHGFSGNSRSATLVLAYIMEKYNMAMRDALQFVKTKRNTVEPNEGFKAQLLEYEPIYKARQNLAHGGSSSCKNRPKRKMEQLSEDVCDYDLVQRPPTPTPGAEGKSTNSTPMEFSDHLYRLLMNR
ncbi:unnamed protein product [Ceutorhynchus assimilis]|uniref:Uncharacterized protein n=1 Tax=Ceutorhynchus assimilis TaxID=467358 RepID=A0A9N9MEU1_9CUCU|nr:unnamed protein product [Ceutorhynchus assimilis]